MSRAFVKEPDGDQVADDQPDLPQSPHPNYITPTGLAGLRGRLAALDEKRRELAGRGDELESKLRLSRTEREIRYVAERIRRAIPVDPAQQPGDEVCFGAAVTVVDEDGARRVFAIVGEDEADAGHGRVSWTSPLARALTGARVGDFAAWTRPAGDTELEILAIAYPDAIAYRDN